jgi:hypothetical protein
MKASVGAAADDASLGRLPGRDQVRGQNHIDTGYGVKKVAAQKKITCNDQDLSWQLSNRDQITSDLGG